MNVIKSALVASTAIAMTACSAMYPSGTATGNSQKVDFVGNPASAYCMNEGGYITLDQDENGHNKIGMCHTASGEVIEQWEYYNNAVNAVETVEVEGVEATAEAL